MEIRQLRYFVAVAELNSFTRAAERCFVSQPSLSQQIIKLEEFLGVELIDRGGRTMQLTDAGHWLYARAVEILGGIDEAERRLRGLNDEPRHIHIGLIPTIAPFVIDRLLRGIADTHGANLPIRIHEDVSDRLIDAISAGGLDFAIIALPWRHASRVHTSPLWRESLLLMLPVDHPLAASDAVPAAAVRDLPFVSLGDMHCLSEHVHLYCDHHRFEPDIVSRAAQLPTLQQLVAAGHGVAMVPAMAAADLSDSATVVRPIADDPPQREIAVAWRSNRRFTPQLDAMLTLLRTTLPPPPSPSPPPLPTQSGTGSGA